MSASSPSQMPTYLTSRQALYRGVLVGVHVANDWVQKVMTGAHCMVLLCCWIKRRGDDIEFKFIRYSVMPSLRERFSRAQEAWSVTANCEGFLNQCGGWDVKTGDAIVLSSWTDSESLAKFMSENHDEIDKTSKQRETYKKCAVSHLRDALQIPSFDTTPQSDAEFIRIASCDLKPDSEQRFLEIQETIWNPGMSSCKGMLGGTLMKDSTVKNRYLAVSFWKRVTDHLRYMNDVFPSVSQSANIAEHLESITSYRVLIERNWQIHSVT